MFAANRIARQLAELAELSLSGRFVVDDVLGLEAKLVHTWFTELGDDSRPAELLRSTLALRLEAKALFAMLLKREDVGEIARRARRWADAVQGWASLRGGAS